MNQGDILLCNVEIMGESTNSCYIELKYDGDSIKSLKKKDEYFKKFIENINTYADEILFTYEKVEDQSSNEIYDEVINQNKKIK